MISKQGMIVLIVSLGLLTTCYANSTNSNSLSTSPTNIERIVLLRHAEKPSWGLGQLSCQGLNRALALAEFLPKKFGIPNYVFAPSPCSVLYEPLPYDYVRPLATIEPFAIKYNIPVNTSFQYYEINNLGNELLSKKYHSALIFVVWEHVNLVAVAKFILLSLNGDPNIIPSWSGKNYDSLYIIDIDWNKHKVSFSQGSENLNNQNKICPDKKMATTFSADNNLCPFCNDEVLIFIPVAETGSYNQLTCQGLNRALALQNVLSSSNPNIKHSIDTFIAPSAKINQTNNGHAYIAGLMTIEPTAIDQVKPMSCPYSYEENNEITSHLLQWNFYRQTVAIAWPREQLPVLLKSIYLAVGGNVNDIPKDTPNQDTLYKIEILRDPFGKIKSVMFTFFSANIHPNQVCR